MNVEGESQHEKGEGGEPHDRKSRFSGRIRGAVTAALSLLILVLVWSRLSSEAVATVVFREARWGFAIYAGLIMIGAMFLAGLRYNFALKALGYEVSYRDALSSVLAAWPLSMVAPGRFNDFARAVILQDRVPISSGSGAVIVERIVDIQTLLILSTIGTAVHGMWSLSVLSSTGLVAIFGVLMLSAPLLEFAHRRLPPSKLQTAVLSLARVLEAHRRRPRHFWGLIACSTAIWALALGIAWLLLRCFRVELNTGIVVALWPLAALAGSLPISFGGAGTRDVAFVALLAAKGIEFEETAVLTATAAYFLITAVFPALLSLPVMLVVGRGRAKRVPDLVQS